MRKSVFVWRKVKKYISYDSFATYIMVYEKMADVR